jgi:DNA-binding response OmpR family regulator
VQIIIENLVGNALKYTQQDGSVCLTIDLHDNQLSISVADNGMGIPSKDKLKLFEGFFRARNAAASDAVGTGIGLMLTKKLVMIHKGKISFESEENMGSEFWVNLSCDKKMYREDEIVNSEIKKITESHETTDNINRMQILLVEDNDDLRVYLALQLRKKFDVIEARDGLEAMEILSKESPDLILSDILMPKSDGFELCEKVKADIATCHIPLILLTSLTERENVIKGLNLGADDYISKPFDMSILESKINTIFSNRALFRRKYIEKSITLNENEALSELNNSFLKKLVELIDSNIANEDFNIEDMAYHMAMSRSVFFKKVKSLTGQNPKDFTRDIKMSRAADLLRDKKYSIAEIAYLTGFPNAKYFSTAFKKYHGVSPTNFIEREKREDNFAGNLGEQEHDN